MSSLVDTQEGRTPNLWWPDDHARCVASEIDLPWTYAGGSAALIADVLAEARVEAQPASPGDNHHQRAPVWLAPGIAATTRELLDSGKATFHTCRGTIHMQLERPQGQTGGSLRTQRESPDGTSRGSGWIQSCEPDPDGLRDLLMLCLTSAVIELL